MSIALFPGRFDPVTNGHRDIARRSARMFDRLIVAAADLRSNYLFTTDERVGLLREALADLKNVEKAVNDLADEAVAFAEASPEPPPEELFRDVYKD